MTSCIACGVDFGAGSHPLRCPPCRTQIQNKPTRDPVDNAWSRLKRLIESETADSMETIGPRVVTDQDITRYLQEDGGYLAIVPLACYVLDAMNLPHDSVIGDLILTHATTKWLEPQSAPSGMGDQS